MVRAGALGIRVDGDVVVADRELERLVVGIGEERLRLSEWHVAVDAVVGDPRAHGREPAALLRFVAIETIF